MRSETMHPNVKYWIGMFAAICMALGGQSDWIPDGWLKHLIIALGVAGSAATGYMIRQPDSDRDNYISGGRV